MHGSSHDRRPFSRGRFRLDETSPGPGEPADDSGTELPASEPVRLPIQDSLDLHAFEPSDVPSVVDEYLREAQRAGFKEVRLIHGRGTGVQRGIVQNLLEHNPLVLEFWDAPESHLGATVAKLV